MHRYASFPNTSSATDTETESEKHARALPSLRSVLRCSSARAVWTTGGGHFAIE